MFDGLQILSTRPNTSKHDQTAPNKVDKVAKRWNVCIGHQTFPIWTGFKFKHGKSWPARYLDILFFTEYFYDLFYFLNKAKLAINESDISVTFWRHCQGKLN